MIIALDARPLVGRQPSGAAQHARNLVAQWVALNTEHYFIQVLDAQSARRAELDQSLPEGMGEHFPIKVVSSGLSPAAMFAPTGSLPPLSPKALGVMKFDVFHSFTPVLPRSCTAPAVMTIHDLACELDFNVRRSAQGRTERLNNRWSLRRAQYVVAVSTQTRNDTMNVYGIQPDHVHVIFNGINPIFHPESNPELASLVRRKIPIPNRYILLVGSDIPRRNYPRIFQAMATVWRDDPTLKLLLVGHNAWPTTPIYRQAQAAGVLDRMVFAESPTDAELAQLYREAVLTCCGSSFEGFGLSVLEAMACGCPVACSDMTSLREVAGKAVLFFAHDDPESISRAVKSLAADAEYRRQLGRRGLAQAAGFTWLAAARSLLQILETCAGASSVSNATSEPESP